MQEALLLQRNWWQRTFSKFKSGSMEASAFALISTALGVGCFAIPSVMRNCGCVLGSILLLLAAFFALVGMNNISKAAAYYRQYDYTRLVNQVLGRRYAISLEILLSIYLFLSLIANQIIAYNCVEGALLKSGLDIREYKFIFRNLFTIFLIYPLSLTRRISGMSALSMLSMGCVVYIAIVIIGQMPNYVPQNDYTEDLILYEFSNAVFPSFCICMYSYICHMNVASVYAEVRNPIVRKMEKANLATVGFETSAYLAIGVFGYLSSVGNTPDMYFERAPAKSSNNDLLMLIGQGLVAIVVTVALICLTLPCRHNITRLICRVMNSKPRSDLYHVSITLFIVFGPFAVSIYIPQVIVVLEFLGAACPLFCNLLPAMLVATTEKHYWCRKNVIQLGLAGIVCLVAFVSVVQKVLYLITG